MITERSKFNSQNMDLMNNIHNGSLTVNSVTISNHTVADMKHTLIHFMDTINECPITVLNSNQLTIKSLYYLNNISSTLEMNQWRIGQHVCADSSSHVSGFSVGKNSFFYKYL